ncbi:MAG TPA: TetR/AcrR family transcriptional regulator [Thiobacillus sp.]|nr:MAG: TetR family transcriptional regulator [Hydrogenophilales bacterium 28-61-11]OYZ59149.1 MAG: TetR family transcriptional regulator [Hydrogenophilales bacterium 16-61-112]OZA46433.1 MAG: TetR family transcriptional regulator [Hydrogenophilales bacterium 17-61-76]HQT31443.1 TetR/AcrR family transcriptional regulator [Thiobacillus sp.]HQT70589.1 TetR/AcrR family transcriptional regulator [Thiobacillus sp.]
MTRPAISDSPSPTARSRILHSAHDLFYREGIRATGVDRIIAESGVAKLTFYRHFPSKNDLIVAYLEYRHARWMGWLADALARYGGGSGAILPAVEEWFRDPHYRGCAFINTVGELGATLPEVVAITRRHKDEATQVLAAVLPASKQRLELAQAIAMAIDGAIVRAQFDHAPDAALAALDRIIRSLLATKT